MRVQIVHKPTVSSIDGVRVDYFEVGLQYELGNSLAAVMLAEGWAFPVALDEVVPTMFTDADPFTEPPYRDRDSPPNLSREHYPPYLDSVTGIAAERERRRRPRKR
jgi:hypothetical protein